MSQIQTTARDDAGQRDGVLTSADGTRISWTARGRGPGLVMVHCVATSRTTTPQPTLPASLAQHFTVYTFDRRGTGLSGVAHLGSGYAVEREFEDLHAMLDLARADHAGQGDPVTVYGFSSGATLSLLAARAGLPIDRLVLLEPPLFPQPDPDHHLAAEAQRRIDADLAGARRWFDTEVVGVPAEVLEQMPPATDDMLRNTRTIVHELTFLPGTTARGFAGVEQPTLLLASDHTAPDMLDGCRQLADSLPHATHQVLPGEWHGLDDATITAAVVDAAAEHV